MLTFQGYNIAGGIAWGTLFIWGGYLFGNIPLVKNNFGLVTLGIIAVSLVPMVWTLSANVCHCPARGSALIGSATVTRLRPSRLLR